MRAAAAVGTGPFEEADGSAGAPRPGDAGGGGARMPAWYRPRRRGTQAPGRARPASGEGPGVAAGAARRPPTVLASRGGAVVNPRPRPAGPRGAASRSCGRSCATVATASAPTPSGTRFSEGFTERDVVMTLLHGRELARYLDDRRLLVLGWLPVSRAVRLPLHVVAEYGRPRWVDVVTAFIPTDPHRVVSRRRLAELVRPDPATRPRRDPRRPRPEPRPGSGGGRQRKSARALASSRSSSATGSTPRSRASSFAVWRT
jgi:hypothetical protein